LAGFAAANGCGFAGRAAANGFGSAVAEPGLAVWPAVGAAAAGFGEGEDTRERARASASALAKTIAQAKAVATAILDTDASLVGAHSSAAWLKSGVGARRTLRSSQRLLSGIGKILSTPALHPAARDDTSHRVCGDGIGHAKRN
jgi:hypothetical protein